MLVFNTVKHKYTIICKQEKTTGNFCDNCTSELKEKVQAVNPQIKTKHLEQMGVYFRDTFACLLSFRLKKHGKKN